MNLALTRMAQLRTVNCNLGNSDIEPQITCYPHQIQKDTSKCSLHFRLGFKTRDLIGYWYYLMSAMQIVANEIARFKSRFGKTEVQGTF